MAKEVKKKPLQVVKETAAPYRPKKIASRNHGSMPQQKNAPLFANKPSVKENINPVIYWLGGASILSNQIRSDFDLLLTGSNGIPKSSIDELANNLGISRKSMAEDILDLSVKTLERKAPGDKLDKRTSSHALEIAKVLQHAFEVFEDEEKTKRWMSQENKALNGMKPLQLFDTLTGLNMVNDILGRIEEGVYS